MFGYTLYYNGGILTDCKEFDSYQEAEEDVQEEIGYRVSWWKREGAWDETDDLAYFEYDIYEED